jgi:hypothetical protein
LGPRTEPDDLFLGGQHVETVGANSSHHHVNTVRPHINRSNNGIFPRFFRLHLNTPHYMNRN